MKTAAVIVSAGKGHRMAGERKKQFLSLAGKPILSHTLDQFESCPSIDLIHLVAGQEDLDYCLREIVERYGYRKVSQIVPGGKVRQESVKNGVDSLPGDVEIVAIHDGVRPFVTHTMIEESIRVARQSQAAIVAVPAKETVKMADSGRRVLRTLDRESLWQVQTPQTFLVKVLQEAFSRAIEDGFVGTDDASLVERIGIKVHIVPGAYTNIKITTPEDLLLADSIFESMGPSEKKTTRPQRRKPLQGKVMRIGFGYDVHPLVPGRPLILGGVRIPYLLGLQGHSDADVLLHAICDALLGAIGEGDIGKHFPDTDPQYRDIRSMILLKKVGEIMGEKGYRLFNLDATSVAEKPKLADFIPRMLKEISQTLETEPEQINIKATTTEGLGFPGRGEGIAAYAVASVEKE